ncbi:MAG: hypothetical protein DMG18_14690, partial [Acidobacteria bacterium]
RTMETTNAGLYRFGGLPAGNYDLTIEAPGFKTVVQKNVPLTVGAVVTVDAKLEVGGVTETVSVAEEVPVIETTRSSVATTIDMRSVADLPINGRSFLDPAISLLVASEVRAMRCWWTVPIRIICSLVRPQAEAVFVLRLSARVRYRNFRSMPTLSRLKSDGPAAACLTSSRAAVPMTSTDQPSSFIGTRESTLMISSTTVTGRRSVHTISTSSAELSVDRSSGTSCSSS